jgi:hypothetical protein
VRIAFAATFAAVILTACASAPATEGATQLASEEGKVCKREVATGSNMPQRVCKTREEWNATSKQDEAGIDDFRRIQSDAGTPGVGN